MPSLPKTQCSRPACPNFKPCPEHASDGERARGTARQRGYGGQHEQRFRRVVLNRDRQCVLCRRVRSTVADHFPRSRRELVRLGLDPNDPQYGRGLCTRCHSSETAKRQPGGWNA